MPPATRSKSKSKTTTTSQSPSSETSPPTPSASSLSSSLRPQVLSHLKARAYPKTICPSEVARSFSNAQIKSFGVSSGNWRDLMPALRTMSFEMRDEGVLEIMQKGNVVERERGEEDVSGPIRLRLCRDGEVVDDGDDGGQSETGDEEE